MVNYKFVALVGIFVKIYVPLYLPGKNGKHVLDFYAVHVETSNQCGIKDKIQCSKLYIYYPWDIYIKKT